VVASVLSVAGFLGGIIFVTGSGLAWLDIVDHFLSNYGLVIACLLECIVLAWLLGPRLIREHANPISSFRLGRSYDWLMRYVIPAIILILIVNNVIIDLREPYGGYSWLALVLIGRDWLLLTLIAALLIAMRPWRKPLR
jgi:neurotransmitter:Na+ symporter, NSS family